MSNFALPNMQDATAFCETLNNIINKQQATPETKEPRHDPVNHPTHYTSGKIECIDALEAATVNLSGVEAFCTANAIKYLWRWKQKNGVEDLKKAVWYINRLISREEEKCTK